MLTIDDPTIQTIARVAGRPASRILDIVNNAFENVDVRGKTVLDIGCGLGELSFAAVALGAKSVVALEPELDGTTTGFQSEFEQIATDLGVDNTVLRRETFQESDLEEDQFDIVVMYNTVNHLDETACVSYQKSDAARQNYKVIFEKLFRVMTPTGDLVITDCGNRNLFGDIGLTNPFVKTIEWEKHQMPATWAEGLKEVGFSKPTIKWNALYSLGPLRKLFSTKLGAYLTNTHFILHMRKQ